MANQVEIDVVLTGAEEASRGLKGVGETAGKMANRFNDENSKLGEGLGNLTDSVGETIGSVLALKTAAIAVGNEGAKAWLKLLGPIGAVIAAVYSLYEVYQLMSGGTEEAENKTEAMAAAASDLESKLESLAEKGVIPTTKALDDFIRSNIEAQLTKEALQKKVEKLRNEFSNLKEAEDGMREARRGDADYLLQLEANIRGVNVLRLAQKKYVAALREYREKVSNLTKAHKDSLHTIREAAEKEKALEDQSAESTLQRVRENIALLNTLQLREAEIQSTGTAFKVRQIEIGALKESSLLRAKENEESAKKLLKMEQELKKQIAGFKQLEQLDRLTEIRKKRIESNALKLSRKSLRRIDTNRIKEIALEKQKQQDLKILRQLELQEMQQNDASALRILAERFNDEIALAGENQNKVLIASKKFELAVTKIEKDEQAKRQAAKDEQAKRDAERIKQAQMMALDNLEFDKQMQTQQQTFMSQLPILSTFEQMSFETERELDLLKIRYDKERALAEGSQEQINEINRRAALERQRINEQSNQALINQVGEVTKQYGAGVAEAVFTSALMGESFSKSIGGILLALGKQASVESLMQIAKGTAALFVAPKLAGNHFAAAGLFAGAATAAGLAGKSLGGGGSVSVGGGGGATPSGAPTTAPTPQREQAEQAPMVFNINFGGAVIYDTKRSAEQAFADRITTLQNTRRRGAPRRF